MFESLRNKGLLVAGGCLVSAAAVAENVSYDQPTYDRWNYPFNTLSGQRNLAPTFAAGFTPGAFDDADGQFYFAFDTSGDFAAGQGAANYQINSVTVTATTAFGGFAYDDTYDASASYAAGGTDADAGRPIHLFGTGFRNGFTAETYGEDGAYAFADPTSEGVRSAYAVEPSGGSLTDVSNFVRDGVEINPFATGGVAGLSGGDTVGDDTTYTFEVDLSDPDTLAYFQDALDGGLLPLSIISMHTASQTGSEPTPQFYTNDNLSPSAQPVTLAIDATVIPEPGSLALLSAAGLVLVRRRRRA